MVASMLKPFLGRADLLTEAQEAADPDDYVQHLLHVEGDGSFSFNGTANADEFITGGKITVSGRLQADGTGAGTARMVEDSRKHGRCDSSIGHWTASGS